MILSNTASLTYRYMVSETGWLNLIFYHPLSHWQFTKPMQRKTGRNLLDRAWTVYALAADLTDKDEKVQVATLLTIIGEDAREVYSTFDWENEGDEVKMELVLKKFSDYCEPRKNVPFERYIYKFNRREQAAGESYDQYRTALRKLAQTCAFNSITPDEMLRDRLVFGISNNRVRECLLRETDITLKKTDEICHAAECMSAQMSAMSLTDTVSDTGASLAAVRKQRRPGTVNNHEGRRPRMQVLWFELCVQQQARAVPCVWENLQLLWDEKSFCKQMQELQCRNMDNTEAGTSSKHCR